MYSHPYTTSMQINYEEVFLEVYYYFFNISLGPVIIFN